MSCQQKKKGGSPPRTALRLFDLAAGDQAGRVTDFLRRRENAAIAPAPNSTTIEGSGTLVPEVEPVVVVEPHLCP
jgi:hypothetical protein